MERYKAPPLDPYWTLRARCTDGDPDALFVQGAAQKDAARICRRCLVRRECAADALNARRNDGAWGGMPDRERRQLIRIMGKRVVDWGKIMRHFPPQFTFEQLHGVTTKIAEKIDARASAAQTEAAPSSTEQGGGAAIPNQRAGAGEATSAQAQPIELSADVQPQPAR